MVFTNFYPRTVVMGLRSAALRAAVELRYELPTVSEKIKCLGFGMDAIDVTGITGLFIYEKLAGN